MKKIPGNSLHRKIFMEYRRRCRLRKISFKLSFEDFCSLIVMDCAYCGKTPSQVRKLYPKDGSTNGIDRVDNKKGYVFSNCVAACKECNQMKTSSTLKEFLLLVKSIYEKHKAKISSF